MNTFFLDDLLNELVNYSNDDINMIKKAYEVAFNAHSGQFRQSGEDYIIHPLNVAYILAKIRADSDTICAGLLHDTVEDTYITKDYLEVNFNSVIANLVDGVTKVTNLEYNSKAEKNNANFRKIVSSLSDDVRIIVIKLADRLHNMRTLDFKSEFKQKEKSLETLEIYAPLAYYIGAYVIKLELEELSFKYLKNDSYLKIKRDIEEVTTIFNYTLEEMKDNVKCVLDYNKIKCNINLKTKNLYDIYKRTLLKQNITDIHDLYSINVTVDTIDQCYLSLGKIHSLYHPINDKFKDYICSPKTNMYQGLHTTVIGQKGQLVQIQIRTVEMNEVAFYGLSAYWVRNKENKMQNDLEKFQFYQPLLEIDKLVSDNENFVNQVKNELFAEKIYIYKPSGDILELPLGSTGLDFAYKIHTDVGDKMVGLLVNGVSQNIRYRLKNKDRVFILTDDGDLGLKKNFEKLAYTSYAKRRLKEYQKNYKSRKNE